jgi:hypothetical protein
MSTRSFAFFTAIVLLHLAYSVHSKSDRHSNKKLYELLSNLNIVDFIDNGWIELNPSYTDHRIDKYIVKCETNFVVNSNVSFVRKQQSQQQTSKSKNKYSKEAKNGEKPAEWTPVNDYQIKNVPLCASKFKPFL